jgi:beta-galactosidase
LYFDINKYPKGLCEQGCGSQMTLRNRFVVDPKAIESHLQNQVGRGMNMVGYYMFHGGTQLPGLKEPGCPMSYDFQAPISESGYLNQSYKELKVLHNFINDFGGELAAMQVVEAPDPCRDEKNLQKLRYIGRTNGKQGFIFLCNSQAHTIMPDKEVALSVKLPDEVIEFPAFTMKGQTAPILPFNLEAGGILLKYVLAQPLARIQDGQNTTLFFTQLESVTPQVDVDISTAKTISAEGWTKKTEDKYLIFTVTNGNSISLKSLNGTNVTLLFLTREQAEHAWRCKVNNKPSLLISEADVIANDENIELYTINSPDFHFKVYPQIQSATSADEKRIDIINHDGFSDCRISYTPEKIPLTFKIHKDKAIIHMPGKLNKNLCDVFVETEYSGGSIDAFQNGVLVTDNLYNGQPWLMGLKRYFAKGDLTLQVQPWNDKITGVNEALVNEIKKQKPVIHTMKLIPHYKTVITIK